MSDRVDHGTNTVNDRELIGFARELNAADETIEETTTAAAAARGVRSGIMKRMKKAGTDMDAFEDLRRLMKVKDDDERNRRVENMHGYAAALSVVLYRAPTAEAPQGALWDDDTKAASQEYKEDLMRNDAQNTRRIRGAESYDENPHPAGSREHQVWSLAWKEEDRRMQGKPDGPKVADTKPRGKKPSAASQANPKKRGRPPKNAEAATVN